MGEWSYKKIRNQDALKVIHDLYKQEGLVYLNYIWLRDGCGVPPLTLELGDLSEDYQTYFFYNRVNNNNDYKDITISGNYAEPYATFGSNLIIKNQKCCKELQGCLVYINYDSLSIVEKLDIKNNKEIIINNKSEHLISILDISYIGRVVWIRMNQIKKQAFLSKAKGMVDDITYIFLVLYSNEEFIAHANNLK
jgi:hypothetical protein